MSQPAISAGRRRSAKVVALGGVDSAGHNHRGDRDGHASQFYPALVTAPLAATLQF